MSRVAYQYAILRFMPYVETGEFANVGLVMAAPGQGFFAYQLQEKRYARLTHFFKDLDGATYIAAIKAMQKELCRIQQYVETCRHGSAGLFEELIRSRETLFRFSEPSLVLTDAPENKLAELYGHYVEHDFVTPQYRETQMESRLRQLLIQADLADRFSQKKLGDEQYRVSLPFVEQKEGRLLKAMKPLFLGQKETSKILEKAGRWQFRVHELQRRHQCPEELLFAVDGPEEQDTQQYAAYLSALKILDALKAKVVPMNQHNAVLEFALD